MLSSCQITVNLYLYTASLKLPPTDIEVDFDLQGGH